MDPSYFLNTTNLTNPDDFPALEALGVEMQAFFITVYSLTTLLALGGNVVVVGVLAFGKRSSRDLRVFLINLAISDITMATFSIPFTYTDFMLGRWIFDPNFCPMVLFMQLCSVIVSVYTLMAVGLDRFYAIMYPLRRSSKRSKGLLILVVIWLIAIGISSVQLVQGRAEKFWWAGEEYYKCGEAWSDEAGKLYTVIVFIVTFLLPLVMLSFTYSCISWKLWKHNTPGNADVTRDMRHLQTKIKTIKMLVLVVVLFTICWLPIQTFNLLVYLDSDFLIVTNEKEYNIFVASFFICHWMSMANSFVNPIIYCFMSDNFRTDLKQLLFCNCSRSKEKTTQKTSALQLQDRSCMYLHSSTFLVTCRSNPTAQRVIMLKANKAAGYGSNRFSSPDLRSRMLLFPIKKSRTFSGLDRELSSPHLDSRSLSSV
ncbi:RYamide receptor-like [Limulus polyphemus]|uniref:RYamide receptor-like n=1 Tax=Limulus polyphemus TaxID=6850 RepID=A0ABM1BSM1_LIMPO|nr:RYamide receptor-like [Limulus polyphemus]